MNSQDLNSTSSKYHDYSDENYDDNKYFNLGLSINSQELITHLYHSFNENDDNYRQKFEDILYAVLDDIQKYKNENERLERAHKSEKEKNDEIMSNMIEEAERQLVFSSEQIKENIYNECERTVASLVSKHNAEVNELQENLKRLHSLEKEYHASKNNETTRIMDLNEKISNLEEEKRKLIESQRELITQTSVLRSEIAILKTTSNEKELDKLKMNVFSVESADLKHEIQMLHQTNRKLNETNDTLLNEINSISSSNQKAKLLKQQQLETVSEKKKMVASTPSYINSKLPSRFFPNRPNFMLSDRMTDDEIDLSDEEIDSGNWTINSDSIDSELNRTNTLSKEIDLCNNNNNIKLGSNLNSIKEIVAKPEKNALPERIFKLCFVGDSAVGKTSFIMRYCMGTFYQSTSATLGVDFHIKVLQNNGKNIALQLWDTCGQERFRSIAVSYFRKADGAVLMYDCTNEKTFLNAREWVQSINYMSDKAVPVILVANKIDLRDELRASGKRVIEYEEGLRLAGEFGSLFFETSIKDGTNVDDSLNDLVGLMNTNQEKEIQSSSNIKLGEKNNPAREKKCC